MAELIPEDHPWPDFPDPVAVSEKAARLERDITRMAASLAPLVAAFGKGLIEEPPPIGGPFGAAGRFLGLLPKGRKTRSYRALRSLWESLALLEKFFENHRRKRDRKGGLSGSWRVRRGLEDTIFELDSLVRSIGEVVKGVGKEIPSLTSG